MKINARPVRVVKNWRDIRAENARCIRTQLRVSSINGFPIGLGFSVVISQDIFAKERPRVNEVGLALRAKPQLFDALAEGLNIVVESRRQHDVFRPALRKIAHHRMGVS